MEKVLVVPNDVLQQYIPIEQFFKHDKELISNIIQNNYSFMNRDVAEYNYKFKQIIPYVLVCRSNNYFLLLQRKPKQTEKRLHNKLSLGIGGHINSEVSNDSGNIIIDGLKKELNEEVYLEEPYQLEFIGILNDNSVDVGKVHLGLVYMIRTENIFFEVLEKNKMTAKWVNSNELTHCYSQLESWSQILHDQLISEMRDDINNVNG